MQKLTYNRLYNLNNVISIDLHNGYSVIALSGWNHKTNSYTTTLFLKDNAINTWHLIEDAKSIEFHANSKTINSAILKQVSTYQKEGFFDDYIKRCDYETSCFNMANELVEKIAVNH